MPPLLRAVAGPYAGQSFPLTEGSVVVGREQDCGICLTADTGVSRRHAQLDFHGDRLVLHDLGSSNGIFLNGGRTVSTIVQPGDRLHLGNTIFEVVDEPPPAIPAPSAIPARSAMPASSVYTAPDPAYGGTSFAVAGQAAPIGPMAPIAPMTPDGQVHPAGQVPPGTAFSGEVSGGAPSFGAAAPGPGGSPGPGWPPGDPFAAPMDYGMYPPRSGVPYAFWLYFLGFSIPPIGIVLAVIYWLKDTPDEQRVGKILMVWSVIGLVLGWISYVMLMHALKVLAPQLQGGGMNGLLGGGDASSTLNQSVPSSFTRNLPGLHVP